MHVPPVWAIPLSRFQPLRYSWLPGNVLKGCSSGDRAHTLHAESPASLGLINSRWQVMRETRAREVEKLLSV